MNGSFGNISMTRGHWGNLFRCTAISISHLKTHSLRKILLKGWKFNLLLSISMINIIHRIIECRMFLTLLYKATFHWDSKKSWKPIITHFKYFKTSFCNYKPYWSHSRNCFSMNLNELSCQYETRRFSRNLQEKIFNNSKTH